MWNPGQTTTRQWAGPALVLLNKVCSQEKLVNQSLTFWEYDFLTDMRKGKQRFQPDLSFPYGRTPADCSIPHGKRQILNSSHLVPSNVGRKKEERKGNETEIHSLQRLTKNLRANYKTFESFPSSHQHITAYLFPVAPYPSTCCLLRKKLLGQTKWQKFKFKETE